MFKMKAVLVLLCFVVSATVGEEKCATDMRKLEQGKRLTDFLNQCNNFCTGDSINGRLRCEEAKHCWFHDNKCVLKVGGGTDNESGINIDAFGEQYATEANAKKDENETSARLFNIGGYQPPSAPIPSFPNGISGGNAPLPPGFFPSAAFPSFCPQFPQNCGFAYTGQNDLIPPVNIPYCQRIPCSLSNPLLDTDFNQCSRQPGCAFDHELFQYRSALHQAVLPGVPVCHLAIRNMAFQRRANDYVQKFGSWNPLYTKCLIREYSAEIYGGSPGCYALNVLEHFGHFPKRAGWSSITETECYLIGGCWRATPSGSICVYPLQTNQVSVRSSNDDKADVSPRQLFGLPACLPYSTAATGSDFLSNYHNCLISGCAVNADRNTYLQQLYTTGSNLPVYLRPSYFSQIYSGDVRPDNYRDVLTQVNTLEGQLDSLTSGNNVFRPPNPFSVGNNQNALIALSLQLQNTTGRHLQIPFPNVNPAPFPAGNPGSNLYNIFTNGQQPSFPGFGGQVGYFPGFPPIQSTCPYQPVQYPGLPPLSGSFEGCCEIPFCYTPREQLYTQFSGISTYRSEWSYWTDCSASCGGGTQTKSRSCVGSGCTKTASKEVQTQSCNTGQCPYYLDWTQWSACSASCDGGFRSRSRECQGLGKCSGPAKERERCRKGACPTYRNENWGECDVTCGKGHRSRTVICTDGGDYGCPKTTEIERGECEIFCGTVFYEPAGACNTLTCKARAIPVCVYEGGEGYCNPSEMRPRMEGCCQGFCRYRRYQACNVRSLNI
ncbi:uncharacterized protein LOC143467966 [Clavelina lepadiformis]|uniref:Uncharacterized protein n=1 Tax=Clavelina lepadiformis TaxID=159417 RepID=A0ABP0G402_CLALP